MGHMPVIGARLARESFEPDLVLSDGFATLTTSVLPPDAQPYRTDGDQLVVDVTVEAWAPFAHSRRVFVEEVRDATGFDLIVDDGLTTSRPPTDLETALLRDVIDPDNGRQAEVPIR